MQETSTLGKLVKKQVKMKRRDIWWERWAGGYKPVHWKAWVWLAGFSCAIPLVLYSTLGFLELIGRRDDRIIAAACVSTLFVWGLWFVERHTPPRR